MSSFQQTDVPAAPPAEAHSFYRLPAPRSSRRPERGAAEEPERPRPLAPILRWDMARRVLRVASLLAIDFVGLAGAMTTALWLKLLIEGHGNLVAALHQAKHWSSFAYLVTVLLFARVDLYSERVRRPGLAKITGALFQAAVVSLVFSLASGQRFSSYYIFYGTLVFAAIYICLLRHLHTQATGWLLTRAGYERRALLVGSGRQIDEVAHALSNSTRTQVDVVGFISVTPRPDNGLRSLGSLADLRDILLHSQIQEVILTDPDFPQDRALDLIDTCHQLGVNVQVAPSTMEILIDRAEFVPGATLPLFRVKPPVFDGVDYALKRSFDVLAASLAVIVTLPLMLIIAVAVKLSSRGPIIYRSVRPGLAGRPFYCLKFRTMLDNADQIQDDLEPLNEKSGALFKIKADPRLTPIGGWLRQFSLDELPQLINVLRGEMSLVGPRPLPMRDYEMLEAWHKKRYLVLPGITGLWQVSGRSELDFDDLVRLDFLYLEQWSLFLDLSILIKTIPAVLTRRGAY
ncbi:MAG TPA: sugar transferase [Solirubrobacteraceae bacterium]|nr:sugar transferase [Solirubrobacteraceae bacterium]